MSRQRQAAQRVVIPLSLAPANPDAAVVLAALRDQQIPPGQRSATLLRWLSAYLSGQALEAPDATVAAIGMTDAELDALLDDF